MATNKDTAARMDAALEALRREFATVRTGKATPALLDGVRVEAYGSRMPLNQVASVSTPEPRLLTVQPWDKSQLGAIEKAIQTADLGLNPSNDGSIIRIPIPPLNEDRRKEFVRVLHKMAEDARIAVRHARKEANDAIKGQEKEGELSEDDARRELDETQKLTDRYIGQIDDLLARKEAEVLEV